MGFLLRAVAQRKTRTCNLKSLFFVPVCNSQILVFLILHKSQQRYLLLSDCAFCFSRRNAEDPVRGRRPGPVLVSPGLDAEGPESSGGMTFQQCGVRWKGHSPVQKPYVGFDLHCSHLCERGRKGKLFAMHFCKHIKELCQRPVCTMWRVISAAPESKTFLCCLQLCTHRDKIPSSMKTSLRHQKENLRFRTMQTYSELLPQLSRKRVWKVWSALSCLTILLCKRVSVHVH